MAAKTNKERQAALKARRRAAGLVPVTVWVYPENREDVKSHAFREVRKVWIMNKYAEMVDA